MKIFNTLAREKQDFVPLQPGRASIYVCGPTVYDSFHFGHARAAISFDVLRRYLAFSGYAVTYVTNFTDIDDKIIARALAEGRSWRDITLTYIDEYFELMDALNVKRADRYPKCSDYIEKMAVFIGELIASGHAYESGGDVYFDVKTATGYGALSGRTLDERRDGASGRTGDETGRKRHPADFALWKAVRAENEPHWKSPFGAGRPGWHIECSVMSADTLGPRFDIHGGGQDLVFPHHENERAQSLAHGDSFANYWMHNGFVGFDLKALPEDVVEKIRANQPEAIDEKGNIKLGKSLWKYLEPLGLAQWLKDTIRPRGSVDPMAVRLALLGAHYRKPIHFSPKLLSESDASYRRLLTSLDISKRFLEKPVAPTAPSDAALSLIAEASDSMIDFKSSMDDDLNTAAALAGLFTLSASLNRYCAEGAGDSSGREAVAVARATMVDQMETLGLRARVVSDDSNRSDSEDLATPLLNIILEVRANARASKQFAIADKIRDGLNAAGLKIEDGPDGKPVIKREPTR